MHDQPVFDASAFGARVLCDEYGVAADDGVFDDADMSDGE